MLLAVATQGPRTKRPVSRRHVQQLHQLKAGRARTLVSGSYHLKGETLSLKADDLATLDGDQVHLG